MLQTPILDKKIIKLTKELEHVYLKFETIKLEPNTKVSIFLDWIPSDRKDAIILSSFNPVSKIFVPKTLIDIDYNFTPQLHLCNLNDDQVSIDQIIVCVQYLKIDDFQIHTFPLFNQTSENKEFHDGIKKFKRSTANANGLDIIFEKTYIIQPKQSIEIKLPWHFYSSTIYFPNLFLMRSRFAVRGLACYMDYISLDLVIVNFSNFEIELGDRFVQLVLPPPLCFKETFDKSIIMNNSYTKNLIPIEEFDDVRKEKKCSIC